MKLSNNISLKEMVASQTAERKGINNNPSEDQMNNLKLLCEKVLQPVRDHFGKVVSVSSGYRSEELCEAIGSSKTSQHAKGQAADFEIFGVSNQELVIWINENLDFDQMIYEFGNEENPDWVHVSYVSEDKNRNRILKAVRDDGKTKYINITNA